MHKIKQFVFKYIDIFVVIGIYTLYNTGIYIYIYIYIYIGIYTVYL